MFNMNKMNGFQRNIRIFLILVTILLTIPDITETRTFKLGLMCPRKHIRLGWDINAAAATLAIEKAQEDNLMPGHDVT